jgi:uncharacterized protein YdaU (DUF1376 family)
MSLEAEGAYIRLLAYNWQDGWIPADTVQQSRLCKTTPKKMAVLWDIYLKDCFVELSPGRMVNPRLEKVRHEKKEYSQEQSERARLRWDKQRNAETMQAHMQAHSVGNASAMPRAGNALQSPVSNLQSSGEGEVKPLATSVAGKVPKYTPAFELFWKDSTMRGSKQEAFTVWKKLAPGPELWGEIMSGMLNWMRSDQWQDETKQPHICRWLKRRGWEEIVPRGKAFFSELPSGEAYARAFEESQ